ncbi:FprA family A-type flavoprotein [Mycoplasmatota bacterium WC44]
MKRIEITNDIFYVGVKDFDIDVFDVVMETKYGTTYNSYVVKGSEKTAIFETVKDKFYDEYIENLKQIVSLEEIDYIVVSHTEPDHVSSIIHLLELIPNVKVVGTKAAINYLKDIVNKDFNALVVKDGEELSLGDKTLKFIGAPFLHWPDTMYTYIEEDEILITCDSFGSHYASESNFVSEISRESNDNYLEALRYYYDCIFSPFKPFVLKAITKVRDLSLKYILTGHGPILDERIDEILTYYKEWSTPPKKDKKLVVIPYATCYGYTKEACDQIIEGIMTSEDIEVKTYDINVKNINEALVQIQSDLTLARGILIGSTTINGDAPSVIWDVLKIINMHTHKNIVASSFGSYGWSGEAVTNIMERLKQQKAKTMDGFKFKFKPNDEELNAAFEFGKAFGELL